jgi:hypothetical protein
MQLPPLGPIKFTPSEAALTSSMRLLFEPQNRPTMCAGKQPSLTLPRLSSWHRAAAQEDSIKIGQENSEIYYEDHGSVSGLSRRAFLRIEMGQGTYTSIPLPIAKELAAQMAELRGQCHLCSDRQASPQNARRQRRIEAPGVKGLIREASI